MLALLLLLLIVPASLVLAYSNERDRSIPMVVHFSIAGFSDHRQFTLAHYANIKAAYMRLGQPKIYLWAPSSHTVDTSSEWYALASRYFTLEYVDTSKYRPGFGYNMYRLAAMQKLYEQGGIYMDISMFTMRSFVHEFEDGKVLMGTDHTGKPSGAVVVAPKENEFVRNVLGRYENACSRGSDENVGGDGAAAAMKLFRGIKLLDPIALYTPTSDDLDTVMTRELFVGEEYWKREQYTYRMWEQTFHAIRNIQPHSVATVFEQNTPFHQLVRPMVQHLYPASVESLWKRPQDAMCDLHECDVAGKIVVNGECYADEWIVPGLLSPSNCTFSDTPEWARVHWIMWTTGIETLQERQHRMLEMIFAHDPRAIVFVLTNKLPVGTFDYFQRAGYRLYQIVFSVDSLLRWGWYVGPHSKTFLIDGHKYEHKRNYYAHLADYLRLVLLYKYGGSYADTDALWLQRASRMPQAVTEGYVGIHDFGRMTELANGVIIAKQRWKFIKRLAETTFNQYDPECWSCTGPGALTAAIKRKEEVIYSGGFQALPSKALYPANGASIGNYLTANDHLQMLLRALKAHTMNLHLFSSITSKRPIEKGSVVDWLFERMGLFLDKGTEKKKKRPLRIVVPARFDITKEHIPLPFERFNLLVLQAGKPGRHPATLKLTTKHGRLSIPPQGYVQDMSTTSEEFNVDYAVRESAYNETQSITIHMKQATLADVNWLLSRLRYTAEDEQYVKTDEITVECTFAGERGYTTIDVDNYS